MARLFLAAALAVACPAQAFGQPPPRDAAAAASPPRSAIASITGRVTVLDATPAAVVRRARVTLQSPALARPQTTDTDVEGRFRFTQLAAGSYRIVVAKPGFVTLEHGARHPADRPPSIVVEDAQTVTANVALPRGAAIEGQLTNEEGEPVQNLSVSVTRFVRSAGGMRPVAVRQARTDDLGRYRVHSLPAGEYYVDAASDALGDPVVPGDRRMGLARTFFPGTPRVHEARRVTVSTGQEMTGIDFALAAVPTAVVAGSVVAADGKAVVMPGARMQAVGGPPGEVRGVMDPRTSEFQFLNVPPGD